jgi:hypothetical protein
MRDLQSGRELVRQINATLDEPVSRAILADEAG